MIIFQELSKPTTQAVFARIVGRSEGRVSQWVADGTLKPGESGLTWLHAVIGRLSNEAAGRYSDGPLDLAQERAALARSQREAVDLKNAVARGEYAPISLLSEVLAGASVAVVSHLDQLPGHIKRTCPLLPARALDEVAAMVASARNEWVRATAELAAARLELGDDDEPQASGAEAD